MIDIYDRTIFERRNILSGEYCKDIIQKYESDPSKHQGRALGKKGPDGVVMEHINDIKKCMDLPIRNNGPWGEYTKKNSPRCERVTLLLCKTSRRNTSRRVS